MEDYTTQGDSLPNAPSRQQQPLFLAGGTPSPARSAVNGRNNGFAELNYSSPMRNVAARRALGLSTPRRVPGSNGMQTSSPMLSFPSSTPQRPQNGRAMQNSDVPAGSMLSDQDSEPLDFPSYAKFF